MMLFEEGRVALDEPVAQIHSGMEEPRRVPGRHRAELPDPAAVAADADRRPVAAHLGPDLRFPAALQRRRRLSREPRSARSRRPARCRSMIEALAKIPLEFSPGEAWNYSVSTDVVGYLIGKISGKPFEQFLKERIFDPLGMNDTGFFVPADKAHRSRPATRPIPGRHDVPRRPAQRRADAAGRPRHELVPRRRPRSFPAAAGCVRPRPTISPSAARCSTAANSAASGCSAQRRSR